MLNQPDFGGPLPWPILPPRAGRDTEQGKGGDRMLHALQLYDRQADLRTSIGQNQGCPVACLSKPCIPLAVHVGSMVLICALVLGWVLYFIVAERRLSTFSELDRP